MNMEDEVARGSIILDQGKLMWPPPPPKVVAPPPSKIVAAEPPPPPNYFMDTLKSAGVYTVGFGGVSLIGYGSPTAALSGMMATFSLAGICGKY